MTRRDLAWLASLAAVFLAWHIPLMFRTGPGQDEHWFGVAGITILRSGLPQIPYLPSRDPATICYKADVALYVLPPLSFYLQCLVHLVLGRGIGQARLTSALLGLAAVFLVYRLGRLWFDDRRGALLAATAYAFSRAFLFPATTARPDMAATTFGLLALWWAVRYHREPRRRLIVASGAAAGLSLLAHPFGVVPATQIGLALLASPGPWRRRLGDAFTFSCVAVGVFSLWSPIIAIHPALFLAQFGGNVLNRAGPGLGATLISPVPVLAYQARQIWEHLMPIQVGLYALGIAWCLTRARRTERGRGFLYHLSASILLLIFFEGRHASLGYYSYPAALASIAVGGLASEAADFLTTRRMTCSPLTRALAAGLATSLLLSALVPGAGLRTLWAHVRSWGHPAYDVRLLSRSIMADIPSDRLVAADTPFVLDFYLAGRRVVASSVIPIFYDSRLQPFDYAVFGPTGLRQDRPQMSDLTFIKAYGDPNDPFSSYAELYRRRLPVKNTIVR